MQSGKSGPAPFLRKTYEIVDDPTTDNIISWSQQGSSFVVWRPAEFAKDILPTHFKHCNFSSFVRQLNTYGFRKVDPDRWEFANDGFKRDCRNLLMSIVRRKPSTHVSGAEPSGQSQQQQHQPSHAQQHLVPGLGLVDPNHAMGMSSGVAPGMPPYPLLNPAFPYGIAPPGLGTGSSMMPGMGIHTGMVDSNSMLDHATSSSLQYQQYSQQQQQPPPSQQQPQQQQSNSNLQQHASGPSSGPSTLIGSSQGLVPLGSAQGPAMAFPHPQSLGTLPKSGPGSGLIRNGPSAFSKPTPLAIGGVSTSTAAAPSAAPSTIASALLDAVALVQSLPDGLPDGGGPATAATDAGGDTRMSGGTPPPGQTQSTGDVPSSAVLHSQHRLQQMLTDYLRPGMRLLEAVDAGAVAMGLAAAWDVQQGQGGFNRAGNPTVAAAGATSEPPVGAKVHLHAHRHAHGMLQHDHSMGVHGSDPLDHPIVHSGTTSSDVASAPAVLMVHSVSSAGVGGVEQGKGSSTHPAVADMDSRVEGMERSLEKVASVRVGSGTGGGSEHSGAGKSGSGGSGVVVAPGDVEETTKVTKRSRATLYGGRAGGVVAGQGLPSGEQEPAVPGTGSDGVVNAASGEPGEENTQEDQRSDDDLQGGKQTTPDEQRSNSDVRPGRESSDAEVLAPSGPVRPTPQSLPMLTHNLLAEMAGQLGRLAALAHEVQGLREENQQLRRNMDVLQQHQAVFVANQQHPQPVKGPSDGLSPIVDDDVAMEAVLEPTEDLSRDEGEDGRAMATGEGAEPLLPHHRHRQNNAFACAVPPQASGFRRRGISESSSGREVSGEGDAAVVVNGVENSSGNGSVPARSHDSGGGSSSGGSLGNGSGGGGGSGAAATMSAVLTEHQEQFWAQQRRNDEVTVQMAVQRQQSHDQEQRTVALEARMAQQTQASLDTVELARTLQKALAVQTSHTVAADARSRDLEERLRAQEHENLAQRQVSAALQAKLVALEAQIAGGQQPDEQQPQ